MKARTVLAGIAVLALLLLVLSSSGWFRGEPGRRGGQDAQPAAPAAVPPTRPGPGHEDQSRLQALLPFERLDLPLEPEQVISWEEAAPSRGRVLAVEGTVVRVQHGGRVCRLIFDESRPDAFVGVIFSSTHPDFPVPPEEAYAGRRVRITGEVGDYRGAPQIVIERPQQIRILEP